MMNLKAMTLFASVIAGIWSAPDEAQARCRRCGQCAPICCCVPGQECCCPSATCCVPVAACAPAACVPSAYNPTTMNPAPPIGMDPAIQSLQLEVGRLRIEHDVLKKKVEELEKKQGQ